MIPESPASEPKPGIVRRGNKEPFRKCTNEEKQERVEKVAEMIVFQKRPSEIKHVLSNEYGLKFRQCAEYIACARKMIRESANLNPESARELGISVWLNIIKNGTNRERMDAAREIVVTCGGQAPSRQEISGPNGNPIELLAGPRPLQHLSDADLMELTEGKKIIKLEPARLPEPQPKDVAND